MLGMARHTCSVMLFWSVLIISNHREMYPLSADRTGWRKEYIVAVLLWRCRRSDIYKNIPYTLLWCLDLNNRTDRATCRNLVRQMTSLGFWINNWSVRSEILSELWVRINSESEPWVWTQSLNPESELWCLNP